MARACHVCVLAFNPVAFGLSHVGSSFRCAILSAAWLSRTNNIFPRNAKQNNSHIIYIYSTRNTLRCTDLPDKFPLLPLCITFSQQSYMKCYQDKVTNNAQFDRYNRINIIYKLYANMKEEWRLPAWEHMLYPRPSHIECTVVWIYQLWNGKHQSVWKYC